MDRVSLGYLLDTWMEISGSWLQASATKNQEWTEKLNLEIVSWYLESWSWMRAPMEKVQRGEEVQGKEGDKERWVRQE